MSSTVDHLSAGAVGRQRCAHGMSKFKRTLRTNIVPVDIGTHGIMPPYGPIIPPYYGV